jgi:hypothetical protein
MKILITGERGIAAALVNTLQQHHVVLTGRKNYNIENVKQWASEFSEFDVCINCAYDSWHQISVLEQFYTMWKDNPEKIKRFQGEIAFMQNKWKNELNVDKYYSPNLTKTKEDFSFNTSY